MKLSLCIATFNEEKNIHYPMDSVYDIVDEVIIVDGGSEDKTVEIVKSYGAKVRVIQSDNPIMFHKNKERAIREAKGDWILQLDADESLSDELKKEIEKIISAPEQKNTVAYWLPRKNFFLTRFLEKGGQYPDYTVRFYRNGVATFPCKDVHENVTIKGEIGYLNNPILHFADPHFSRYLMRWDRYTTSEVENAKFIALNKDRSLVIMFFEYFFWKPLTTFFSMYVRHKGFMDGFPGFVFSLFSSLRFYVIYIKWWKSVQQ